MCRLQTGSVAYILNRLWHVCQGTFPLRCPGSCMHALTALHSVDLLAIYTIPRSPSLLSGIFSLSVSVRSVSHAVWSFWGLLEAILNTFKIFFLFCGELLPSAAWICESDLLLQYNHLSLHLCQATLKSIMGPALLLFESYVLFVWLLCDI